MIKLIDIYKQFDEKNLVLNGVSITINAGDFVAIMGTSGCGKTTLINIIGCIERPTSGTFYYENINVSELNKKEWDKFRKEKISFIFQNYGLINDYTVYENIELPLTIRNVDRSRRKKIINEMADMMGIEDIMDKYPPELSGGEKQRVSIARACVLDNTIILADEPTGALDKENSIMVMELLKKINSTGRTIIMVTHDIEMARYANRVLALDYGNIKNYRIK